MTLPDEELNVYLEVGSKRVFAGALNWHGWCRSGRDEDSALEALLAYAPRYASAMSLGGLDFTAPGALADFTVVERMAGNSTTDFGAPAAAPAADSEPIDDDDFSFFRDLLDACWQSLDQAARSARGKPLTLGPRGGGRDLDRIIRHVHEGQLGYLSSLGWKVDKSTQGDPAAVRRAVTDGLAAATRGEIAERGPRGGQRWTPRYFVRRSAWHILDHAWEIEDRIT
jgi:hypothetical protein